MARMVHCVKLNKDLPGLDFPPVPGELGKRIWQSVSKEAWDQWKQLQTMMINEYAINCADPEARKHLMKQCERYLFGGEVQDIPNRTPVADKAATPAAEEKKAE